MKKDFLTFIFACIPGAGQMYYGYMKRGLSLITLFCIGVILGAIVGPLIVVCPIVWMYSFFDTYDLVRRITRGEPREDSLLFFENLESIASLRRVFPSGNRIIGWVLIALGIWALYSSVIEPLISKILGWYVTNMIPTLVVAVLLILGGVWLLRGPRDGGKRAGGDYPPFPGGADSGAGPADLPDDTFGTGPAPDWPKAGPRGPRAGEGTPRRDADSSASAEDLNA